MVIRKTLLAVLCLLYSYACTHAQGLPKACPIYIAHDVYDGSLTTVARDVQNVSCTSGSFNWSSTQALRQNDDLYAQAVFPVTQNAECLSLTDLQLNIPPGSTIHGLEVEFFGHRTGSDLITERVTLVGQNRQRYGRNQAPWVLGTDWPLLQNGRDGNWKYGGDQNTWGANLTSDMVNDPEFGIEVLIRKPIMGDTSVAFLDHVSFKVYYTPLFTICHDSCTIFYVDSVPGATAYHWTLPPKASFLSKEMNSNIVTLNVMDMSPGLHDICVQTISNMGISDFCCMRFRLAECGSGSIGDRVWQDQNENGLQDVGESGLAGIPLELTNSLTGKITATDTTDSQGQYRFDNIPEGHYFIQAFPGAGFDRVPFLVGNNTEIDNDVDESNGTWTTRTFYLASGEDKTDIDLGMFALSGIGDFVWEDLNGNGLQDPGENGIPDTWVFLEDVQGNPLDSIRTDNQGIYRFTGLASGSYRLRFDSIAGYTPSPRNIGPDDSIDSDMDINGIIGPFIYTAGQLILNADAGWVPQGKIQGIVWYDRSTDGLRQASEPRVPDATVQLLQNGSIVSTVQTDSVGFYCFSGLKTGSYDLLIVSDTSMIFSSQDAGNDDSIDSDVDSLGSLSNISLTSPDTLEFDAGYKFNCLAEAVPLEFLEDLPCYSGQSLLLNFQDVGSPIVPPGFDHMYLLIDVNTGRITAGSNVPVFAISQPGMYRIVSWIYSNDPDQFEFLDLSFFVNSGALYTDLIQEASNKFLCVGVSPFLEFEIEECGQISGYIFYDQDETGLQNGIDNDLENVEIELLDNIGVVLRTETTDAFGQYEFDELTPGEYVIRAIAPAGMEWTLQDVGPDDAIDSDLDNSGESAQMNLVAGAIEKIDGGLTIPCEAMADPLGMVALSRDCYSGIPISLSVATGSATIPAGFEQIFFLLDEATGIITESSDMPIFILNSAATYRVVSLVWANDPAHPEYFDLSVVQLGSTTLSDLSLQLTSSFRCHDLNSIGRRIELNSCGVIRGVVWMDDSDGVRQPSETRRENVTVELLSAGNLVIDSRQTDSEGRFEFAEVSRGLYRLRFETIPALDFAPKDAGMDDSVDSDVDNMGISDLIILDWGDESVIDAGYVASCGTVLGTLDSISTSNLCYDGQSFEITAQEVGPAQHSVDYTVRYLLSRNNEVIDASMDPDFAADSLGTYCIHQVITVQDTASANYFDLGAILNSSLTPLQVSQAITENDPCAAMDVNGICLDVDRCAQVGDFVWYDENANGIQDSSEIGLNDQIVRIFDNGGMELDTFLTITFQGKSGYYIFDDLPSGSYFIRIDRSPSFTSTLPQQGSDSELDSDLTNANGDLSTDLFSVTNGDVRTDLDIGLTSSACIGDFVWEEIAFNGIQDFFERGRNDVKVFLRDENGVLVDSTSTQNSANGDPGYYVFSRVVPGTYYVQFDIDSTRIATTPDQGGDDNLDSDVVGVFGPGTTDTFSIQLGDSIKSMDLGLIEKSSVGNRVWCDENANGLQDAGEPGINNVKVFLYDQLSNLIDSTVTADLSGTSAAGYYSFRNILPGAYYIRFDQVQDKVQTIANAGNDEALDSDVDNSNGFGTTSIFNLSPGENDLDVDAGYVDPGLLLSRVGDYVWVDRDNDGIQDGWESGLNGVRVELYDVQDQMIDFMITDYHPTFFSPGYYEFDSLSGGQYYLVFIPPTGYEFTASFAGFDNDKDSDISNVKAKGSSNIFGLTAGEDKMNIDAGFVQYGSLGDYVWEDVNANGVQDAGEDGINGVAIHLRNRNGELITSTTTENDIYGNAGYYVFHDIDPDGYYLEVELPSGWAFTPANQGGDDTRDSDIDNSNGFGTSSIINISPGEHDRDADVGLHLEGVLGHLAWFDLDYDGIHDPNEKGMENVKVYLYNHLDSMFAVTQTDSSGLYQFNRIPIGSYYLMFELPVGYDFSSPGKGHESEDSDVTHRYGYGTTNLMEVYPGLNYGMLDAGVTPLSVLSLQIVDFDVQKRAGHTEVTWTVNDQTGLEQYILERRHEDDWAFESVSIIDKIERHNSYSVKDAVEASGVYEYRLRLIHSDGRHTFSEIKSVEYGINTDAIELYPNPTSDWLYLDVPDQLSDYTVVLRDLQGKARIMQGKLEGDSKLDVRDLPSGMYLLEVVNLLYRQPPIKVQILR